MTAGLQADISSLRPILCADNHELNRRVSHLTGARISCRLPPPYTRHSSPSPGCERHLLVSAGRLITDRSWWFRRQKHFVGHKEIDSAAFFGEVKRCGLRHSDFFICELINRADRINSSSLSSPVIIVSTPFYPVLAFHTPGVPLDPEDISSLCPN